MRVVFLQALYNLSDEAFEHQLLDRLSFQHFCRLDGALNVKEATKAFETLKTRLRVRVEHPFRVVKRQFGYRMVRFKGLVKNTGQILTLFALANLWMVRKKLTAEVRPQPAQR